MTTVVAAVIEQDARILICRRRAADAHPLKWEFPGGKVEPGETPLAALVRELDEELAIRVVQAAEMARYEYQYTGGKPILLIFFRVVEFLGEPQNRIFHEVRWEQPANLPQIDFLEGDIEFVKSLAARR